MDYAKANLCVNKRARLLAACQRGLTGAVIFQPSSVSLLPKFWHRRVRLQRC